jgi:nucleotide-binding universal stress UspA family protein
MVDTARNAGREILTAGEQRVQTEEIKVQTALKEGDSVQEIVKVAKAGQFNLIVIGAGAYIR